VDQAAIEQGIASVVWPGRMQVLRQDPILLLDGAHDPASISALLAALDRHFPGHPRRYVLGFSREKDWPQMIRQLAPTAKEFIFTAASTPRAVSPESAAKEALHLGVPYTTAADVATALDYVLSKSSTDEVICVTGSLYVIGDALRWWQRTH
jgi:dihydrofolate synthase/folylpolyglutamate synthase